MTNQWTTLVEDQTEKANESIQRVLGEEIQSASQNVGKNKTLAIVLAGIGVILIGFGVWPFFDFSSDSDLRGDLVGNEERASPNMFSNTPQTVDNVPVVSPSDTPKPTQTPEISLPGESESSDLLKDPEVTAIIPSQQNSNPPTLTSPNAQNEPINNEKPVVTMLDDDPFADLTPEVSAPILPPNIVPVTPPTSVIPVSTAETPAVPFRQNTHVGTTDREIKIYGEATESSDTETLHHAAPEQITAANGKMAKSGPEAWFALLLAIPGALWVRRKKLFA